MCDIPTWNRRYLGVGRTNRPNKNKQTNKNLSWLLSSEMRVTRKIFTRTAANLFFKSIFGRQSLFFYSFFWFFYSCFFLFVCVLFFEIKIYILIHIRLCGWVNNKKIFTRPISGNKTTFFGPSVVDGNNLHCQWSGFSDLP